MVINKCNCASEIKKSRLEELAALANNGRDLILNASKQERADFLLSEMDREGFCKETIEELSKTCKLANRSVIFSSESREILNRMFLRLADYFTQAAAVAAVGPMAAVALECSSKNAA